MLRSVCQSPRLMDQQRKLVVRAHGLEKKYDGKTVVDRLDLSIPAGRCFGLLGPNGAGKTTTLRMLLGQSPMSGGSLHVFDLPMPQNARVVRKRTGVVPQTDNLDPDFTVIENLRVYGRYFDMTGPMLESRL